MIPRADLANAVQPIASVDAPTALVSVADAKQEAFSRLVQIAVGQQLQGKVLSTYNDGSYLVRIANTAARMVLPTATRAGDSLLLTMVSKDPRPTFLLTETLPGEEESSSVSLSTTGRAMENELHTLNATLEHGTPTIVGRSAILESEAKAQQLPDQVRQESAPATLSTAGKLIDALLHSSDQSQLPKTITSSTPLVNTPTNTLQLAVALHDTIGFSGVFYESHVAAWADGKRPLAQLQKEPQLQLGQQTSISTTDLLNSPTPTHRQLSDIINTQLTTLEQNRVVWHGEVWPGQQMEWEISQESPQEQNQGNHDADQATATWHSLVRFELEHLGTISASIRLSGKQIHMQLRTDNDAAATALRTNGKMLADTMDAVGSPLDSLIVKRDGET